MLPRIVEFRLSENRLQIVAMRVLERRNQAFDGLTTGVVVRNHLYYVANPQTDKKNGARIHPLQVFRVPITPCVTSKAPSFSAVSSVLMRRASSLTSQKSQKRHPSAT
jgi:hypothetical protein